ncbi:translation initiation factor IF-2 [Thermoleptolyngbya sichuanensis A183]|uniref:Translation initiation factor IF-2 n=1 Tax=Thermoleptolyngbya sichuanensis A183 TaxID=2737172 RepID=A0A6M8BE04_9CYAN|nr:translation initiation factor IF-2 [Thermoleptolyngbya sichuanensis]QKD84372.1 translation initiation factor IF-2 [Thermoleptolyngbya sichuanensis A183]
MNGKVRIYELSKELNLDNREILDVCEQLNIPVKSHSSTISEAEAARIRSAAERLAHSPSASHTPPVHRPTSTPSSMPQRKQSAVQPPVKKQQILEVRRHRPAVEPPKRPEAQPAPAPQPTSSAPVRPDRPAAEPAEVRTVEPRPIATPPAVQKPATPVSEAPKSQAPKEVESPPVDAPQPPPVRPEVAESAPLPEEQPSLMGPPSKPVQTESVSSVSRPVLKKASDRSDQVVMRVGGDDQGLRRSPTAARPESRSGEASESAPRRIGITETSEPPVLRAKPVLELRRKPVRPMAPSASEESGAADTRSAGGMPILAEPPTLKPKPTPPTKVAKRGKDWEEEDEENPNKVAKAGVKSKRRSPNVLDDDEDIDLDEVLDGADGDDSAPTALSISLMRPPKPKSQKAPAKPVAVAAPTQRRRGGSSNERFSRRDRREQQETRQRPEIITLTGSLTVAELADMLVVPETEVIRALFMKGIMTTVNQVLDIPTATMVAEEMGILVDTEAPEAEAKKVTEMLDAGDLENLQRRPPVVTIMGHVDHGKTTLLDSIRKTKVAQGEAGGITQHIGAYHVDVEHNGETQQVVFLDTPGHEAFTAMRARGARVTDIAILVVAADDGVRPQTIEAISHAKAAEVPIVVAINKVDKEEAQPDRVKQELTEYGLVAEEWGGDTIMVPVSALTGENLDTLLEMILLVSEVEDLYANPDRPAKGTVIEAHLDKAKGPVATLLIQNGTLRVGDILVAGSVFGKVRAMVDDRGKRVEEGKPSFAVEVLGLSDVPAAGDEFDVYLDEKEARAIASNRTDQQRLSRLQQAMSSRRVSLNTISSQAQEGDLKELNLILKADVQGSVEAILAALQQLPQKEVQVRVLLAAPGEITETDVDLAAASSAVIIGFNTTFASGARQAADQADVDVRDYTVIYALLDDIQGAMEGLLEPELVEEPLGQVEVRAVFTVGKGAVAGCYVKEGKVIRNSKLRVRRGGEVIFEGNLDSLKRMKEDAKEVSAGYECGIGVDNFKDWQEGDIIEVYRLITKRRTLSA